MLVPSSLCSGCDTRESGDVCHRSDALIACVVHNDVLADNNLRPIAAVKLKLLIGRSHTWSWQTRWDEREGFRCHTVILRCRR